MKKLVFFHATGHINEPYTELAAMYPRRQVHSHQVLMQVYGQPAHKDDPPPDPPQLCAEWPAPTSRMIRSIRDVLHVSAKHQVSGDWRGCHALSLEGRWLAGLPTSWVSGTISVSHVQRLLYIQTFVTHKAPKISHVFTQDGLRDFLYFTMDCENCTDQTQDKYYCRIF